MCNKDKIVRASIGSMEIRSTYFTTISEMTFNMRRLRRILNPLLMNHNGIHGNINANSNQGILIDDEDLVLKLSY